MSVEFDFNEKPKTHTPWIEGTLLVCVVAPFLYALSVGPAVRYYDHVPSHVQSWVETIYAPLEWLHDNTFLQDPLDWYIELWRP